MVEWYGGIRKIFSLSSLHISKGIGIVYLRRSILIIIILIILDVLNVTGRSSSSNAASICETAYLTRSKKIRSRVIGNITPCYAFSRFISRDFRRGWCYRLRSMMLIKWIVVSGDDTLELHERRKSEENFHSPSVCQL
ncbi:hypothetical protein Bca4012_073310 [Brassica carinata]